MTAGESDTGNPGGVTRTNSGIPSPSLEVPGDSESLSLVTRRDSDSPAPGLRLGGL
jgi:hypothetical protein